MKLDRIWSTAYYDNFLPLKNFRFNKFDFLDVCFNNFNVLIKEEEFNSLGYRSDEFIKNHEKEHILFVGCSVTYGVGLEKEKTWSDILYKKINQEKETSGYFNLSAPGTSMFDQIFNIFKYFKEFGHPKHLFFNIPEALRFYHIENNIIFNAIYDKSEYDMLLFLGYQYYFMLDLYCKKNNINLYCFSNSNAERKLSFDLILSQNFDTYYAHIQKDRWNATLEYHENNPEDEYWMKAKDNKHNGTGAHFYWANWMYKKYKEREKS
jgi:hypothetical protein